jgi:hypothetical protein
VLVKEQDFYFVDTGQYRNQGLTKDLYYYKVKTRGTYGNPGILSPLENFSQITSGLISDTIPPCKPVVTIAEKDCQQFACDGSDYYTKLEWTAGSDCDGDVVGYDVLVKQENSDSPSFISLGIVTEKTFIHAGISSLNKCYRLISIDQSGNRSDTSEVVCNSNCVLFKLPNIISPGVVDSKNDYLTTYPSDANSTTADCSRSVTQVDIKVFSRWGEEIFTTSVAGSENPIFWDGLNKHGNEVSTGTYFYEAVVTFDTIDDSEKTRQIKGWVHVVR